ncbi:hypothetical protein MNBD_PLANCTO02-3273 [hydrothermal vent metagenome]|uniref:Copper resistance protein D domain-containing protein n=1 Tax=hydrothermal vent metagenome TaxID=652676 RepID=A0A3B1DH33_9ZZZZ
MEILIEVLSRWIHIGTVIVLVGGSVFMRFVMLPAAAELPEEEHNALRGRIINRWKKFVHTGVLLIMISGMYNFMCAIPHHRGQTLYASLIGIKIILAFVVFFLASALVGRSPKFEKMRKNPKKWLAVIITLAAIIVGISGYAKVALKPTSSSNEIH